MMDQITRITPPHVEPTTRPLSILETVKKARRNVLEIIPALAYRQPMISGFTAKPWHMVMHPGALERILKDRVEDYPKSPVVKRILRPAIGESLYRRGRALALAETRRRAGFCASPSDGPRPGDDRRRQPLGGTIWRGNDGTRQGRCL